MPLFDPTTLYLEINDAAAAIREIAKITEPQWLQIEARIDDFIEKLTLMAHPVTDPSKGTSPTIGRPYDDKARMALSSIQEARAFATKRAARPTSEALGRASLQMRGGGPIRPWPIE